MEDFYLHDRSSPHLPAHLCCASVHDSRGHVDFVFNTNEPVV